MRTFNVTELIWSIFLTREPHNRAAHRLTEKERCFGPCLNDYNITAVFACGPKNIPDFVSNVCYRAWPNYFWSLHNKMFGLNPTSKCAVASGSTKHHPRKKGGPLFCNHERPQLGHRRGDAGGRLITT
jgi:hypothetical protein